MLVEIRGIGFANKGAELMLIAVMEKFKERYDNVEFVIEVEGHYLKRSKYGVYQKFWHNKLGGVSELLASIVPSSFRNLLGVKLEKEIDVVIDASGFRYTSQWGVKEMKVFLTSRIEKWNKQKKKIIFLPQAWGPFDTSFKKEIYTLEKNSSLIFSRDAISFENLRKQSTTINAEIYPDFTNLLSGNHLKNNTLSCNKKVAVVPNCRMVDKIDKGFDGKYQDILCSYIKKLKEENFDVYFLIHEGKEDLEIAKELNHRLGETIPILTDEDPLVLKGLLSQFDFVIGSRFHALVSALSQGVPVIALGWSHKYNVLMNDYGVSEYLIEISHTKKQSMAVLDKMILNSVECRGNILGCIDGLKIKSNLMWDKVFEVVG